MEILGRVNVYLDLLRNENARLSNEIFNLVRLNERILRDVEPLFLRDNDLQNKDVLFQSALATVVEAGINLEEARNIPTYRKLLEELDNIAKSKSLEFIRIHFRKIHLKKFAVCQHLLLSYAVCFLDFFTGIHEFIKNSIITSGIGIFFM